MNVAIEKLVYGGDGLAHDAGATLFVPFVLPGEKVAAEPVEKSKKFMRCKLERVLEASPRRVEARCPHFGVCGGCHYQHIPYEAQLQYKEEILRETLRRIGKINWTGDIVRWAFEPWEYRNRAQWKVRSMGERGGGEGGGKANQPMDIGYFEAGSNTFMPAYSCPILAPELFGTLSALREMLKAGVLPVTLREAEGFVADSEASAEARERAGSGVAAESEAAAAVRAKQISLSLSFAKFPSNREQMRAAVFARVPGLVSLLIQDTWQQRMELFGPGSVTYSAGGFQYRVSALSFFQVNRFAIAEMNQVVAELAGEGAVAVDLFCGVGLFSLPLARNFGQVIGVESNPAAVRDFQFNAAAASVGLRGRIESREADATSFLHEYRGRVDALVLDPPRAGLEKDAAERILKVGPKRIVYVSCDPATLARDLAILERGYAISVVYAFDLFPQTYHMETIAGLVKRE